jgi:predicted RNA-binding protein with PIN domain
VSSDGVVVLVDGSNVSKSAVWLDHVARLVGDRRLADHEHQGLLCDGLLGWIVGEGHEALLVFDGVGPQGEGARDWGHGLVVVGSGRAEGDVILERRAVELRASGRSHWVVSDDRVVRDVAGAGADRTLGSAELVAELAAAHKLPVDVDGVAVEVERHQAATSRLRDDLDADTLAKLERMRRGEP